MSKLSEEQFEELKTLIEDSETRIMLAQATALAAAIEILLETQNKDSMQFKNEINRKLNSARLSLEDPDLVGEQRQSKLRKLQALTMLAAGIM